MGESAKTWSNMDDGRSCSKSRIAMIVALCLMVGTIFFIIGFFARSCGGGGGGSSGVEFEKLIREADAAMREFSQQRLSADRIRNHLRGLTVKPHLATLDSDPAKDYLEAYWKRLFDGNSRVKLTTSRYKVLLSRARLGTSENNKTHFEILSSDGATVVFTSQKVEPPLTQYDNDTNIPSPILAYAPSGDVTGGAVYANYGTEADLEYLTRNLSINLNGTILLTRYGRTGRGSKAVTGKKFGAAGVLIFSDPADVAKNQSAVYPDGYWMPSTGTQKGSAIIESGDPTTPGYPSLDSAYRQEDAVARGALPPLPMYPIGYGDARVILDSLDGQTAPSDWRVAINGMNASNPTRLGPGMTGGRRMRLLVNQENYLKEITNLCVEIRGEIEPDRWVIIGNHRDAWGYGAVDPSSGTAVIMELSQILSDMMTQGWKPRRSILLCTWDGEEQGLIGSWEYVEDNLMRLKESVVAYVNIDIAVAGNYTMETAAVPCLRTFAKSLMDSLPEEVNPGHSMGDTWSTRWANGKSAMDAMPTPLVGSDFAAFIQLAGLPVMDIMFRAVDPADPTLYPMYHARYETFQYVDTYVDPGFKAHLSAARLITEITRQLSDEYLLPYALNMTNTAQELVTFFNSVNSSRQVIALPTLKPAVDALSESVTLLLEKARAWDAQTVNRRSPLSVRRINDMAMRAMQSFLAGRGQPRRPYINNLVFASGKYSSTVRFPGLGDLLYELASTGGAGVEEVEQQLRDLAYHVRSAANLLSV